MRPGLSHRRLFLKGAVVGEMVKDPTMLARVLEGREKKEWEG
ncbi:hypothetical protein [Geobacter anodireducens]